MDHVDYNALPLWWLDVAGSILAKPAMALLECLTCCDLNRHVDFHDLLLSVLGWITTKFHLGEWSHWVLTIQLLADGWVWTLHVCFGDHCDLPLYQTLHWAKSGCLFNDRWVRFGDRFCISPASCGWHSERILCSCFLEYYHSPILLGRKQPRILASEEWDVYGMVPSNCHLLLVLCQLPTSTNMVEELYPLFRIHPRFTRDHEFHPHPSLHNCLSLSQLELDQKRQNWQFHRVFIRTVNSLDDLVRIATDWCLCGLLQCYKIRH